MKNKYERLAMLIIDYNSIYGNLNKLEDGLKSATLLKIKDASVKNTKLAIIQNQSDLKKVEFLIQIEIKDLKLK